MPPRFIPTTSALSIATCAVLAATMAVPADASPRDRDDSISLRPTGTYETGVLGESAAEIPAFDPRSNRAFVVNGQSGSVDVLKLNRAGKPIYGETLSVGGAPAADGSTIDDNAVVNSVAVTRGVLAVAVEGADKTDHGWTAFYDAKSLTHLGSVRVGALPDSLAFDDRGHRVVVANEGEPADDFSADPEGTISVIDVPKNARGFKRLSQKAVRTVDFRAFDRSAALPDGVRVFGPDVPVPSGQQPAGRVARNLEPEYVTVSGDTAYVSIQEANAVAVVDVRRAKLDDLWPLAETDWSTDGVLDVSNEDGADGNGVIKLKSWPVRGVPMPDGVGHYRSRGRDLVVTANEGDSREWGDFVDSERVKDLTLCNTAFGDAASLQEDANVGRLNVITDRGFNSADNCYESLHALGGRSFSIYSADGRQIFDSAGMIEQTIADLIESGDLPEHAFNATNDETPSFDSRSDDKGPEPEAVEIGQVGRRTLAFVALERIGGVMTFDVTNPRDVSFVDYVNGRTWSAVSDHGTAMGDLGAEGLEFVSAKDSPTRTPLILVAHEVSGSTTVYEVTAQR